MKDLHSIISGYQPSDKTLEAIRKATLIAVVGPSGVGKTTLMKRALQEVSSIHFVITDVSRQRRPGELPDVDYHFAHKADMLTCVEAGDYVQVALHPSGDLYSTRPASYSPKDINMMAVLASEIQLFRRLPFRRTRTIFIVPPDFDTWQARLSLRNFTPEQRAARLAEAKDSFSFALDDEQTEFVINDNLAQAETAFQRLVLEKDPASYRPSEQAKAREIIKTLLKQLPKF